MVKKVMLFAIVIVLLQFLPADSQTTNNAIFLNNTNLSTNNGFVYLGAPDYQLTDKITISVWIKWNGDPHIYTDMNANYKWGTIITMDWGYYPYHDNGMFWLQHSSDNKKIEWAVKSSTKGRYFLQSNTTPLKDKWYYITGIYDGNSSDTTMKLYINGVLESFALNNAVSGTIVPMTSNYRLNIGRIADGYRLFSGNMDELRIWKRAFSFGEINQQMYSKSTVNPANLLSYYDFDQSTGSTLVDKGPAGVNGKFYNQLLQVNSMSGSPSISITDTSKSWTTDALKNRTIKIVSGTGIDAGYIIAGNTSNTITLTIPFASAPTISGNTNMTLIGVEASPSDDSLWLSSTAPLNTGNLNGYSNLKGVWNANSANTSSLVSISNTNIGVDEYLLFGNDDGALAFSGLDVPDSINGRVTRVWKFQTNKIGGVTGKISIDFTNLNIADASKLRILVSQTGTFAASALYIGTVAGTTVSINNILIPNNSFITLGSKEGTLPVELISFTSVVKDRNVTLNWKTSKEINNKGFEIERASEKNSSYWEKIGYVSGKGTTNESSLYFFTDSKLNSGKYHFRLKQIDYNGIFTYYNLNSFAEIALPGKFELLQNYPNPFNPATKIEFQISNQSDVSMTICDMSGRLVSTLVNKNLQAGYYKIDYNGSNLSSGTYFCILKAGNNVSVKKMVLVK